MCVAFGLQLTDPVCNIKDARNECERTGRKHKIEQGNNE
jgi:hypothetical protein